MVAAGSRCGAAGAREVHTELVVRSAQGEARSGGVIGPVIDAISESSRKADNVRPADGQSIQCKSCVGRWREQLPRAQLSETVSTVSANVDFEPARLAVESQWAEFAVRIELDGEKTIRNGDCGQNDCVAEIKGPGRIIMQHEREVVEAGRGVAAVIQSALIGKPGTGGGCCESVEPAEARQADGAKERFDPCRPGSAERAFCGSADGKGFGAATTEFECREVFGGDPHETRCFAP